MNDFEYCTNGLSKLMLLFKGLSTIVGLEEGRKWKKLNILYYKIVVNEW